MLGVVCKISVSEATRDIISLGMGKYLGYSMTPAFCFVAPICWGWQCLVVISCTAGSHTPCSFCFLVQLDSGYHFIFPCLSDILPHKFRRRVVLCSLYFLLLLQMARLNEGLSLFDAILIVPMFQIVWTFFSICTGFIYFQEYQVQIPFPSLPCSYL